MAESLDAAVRDSLLEAPEAKRFILLCELGGSLDTKAHSPAGAIFVGNRF
jgi:hypothetical protein